MTSRNRTKTYTPVSLTLRGWRDGIQVWTWPQTTNTGGEEMDDVVVPNFHSRIANGEIINNPCVYEVESVKFSKNTTGSSWWYSAEPNRPYTYTEGNLTDFWRSQCGPGNWKSSPCTGWEDTSGIARAKQTAIAHVDSTPYEFFEDLLEIGETLRFLKNPASALEGVINNFFLSKRKARSIKGAADRAKALADAWNQYRFAAAPLARSLLSIAEIADGKIKDVKRPKRRSAHGIVNYKGDDQWLTQTTQGSSKHLKYFTWEWFGETIQEYHASIHYEVSNPIVDWNFKYGLRLKDIPDVTWQILPLSFMLDRLINIRSMIRGLVNLADPNVTILAASLTKRNTVKHEFVLTDISYFGSAEDGNYVDPDWVEVKKFTYDRQPWSPGVMDTLPRPTPKYLIDDLVKTADLLAIITSLLYKMYR